ncbi:MAG: hypothetical protein J2P18_04030 [Nocardia sp.]|nr:hypothetical protein [Nocardia sp.]
MTRTEKYRHPPRGDVHVRIRLGRTTFDYRATVVAALNLVRDCHRKHWCVIELVFHALGESLPEPRLPNERLFLDPQPLWAE